MTARGAAVYSLVTIALAAFVVFFALGSIVSHHASNDLDTAAYRIFYGQRVPLAVELTTAGRAPTYVIAATVSLVFSLIFRRWLRDALFALAALLVTWQVSDFFKIYFARDRPPAPLVFAEPTFSYPSSHASLAMAFFGAWAFFVWRSPLPAIARFVMVAAMGCFTVAVGWSRLALGAHYLIDVIGGYLVGFSFAALAVVASRLRSNAHL